MYTATDSQVKGASTVGVLLCTHVDCVPPLGTIPTTIGLFTLLPSLQIISTYLNGAVPTELWSLTQLTSLYLYSNYFTGTVSPLISSMTGLTALWMYSNRFTGESRSHYLHTMLCVNVCYPTTPQAHSRSRR